MDLHLSPGHQQRLDLTADIVIAFAGGNRLAPADLLKLIPTVYASLATAQGQVPVRPRPASRPPRRS